MGAKCYWRPCTPLFPFILADARLGNEWWNLSTGTCGIEHLIRLYWGIVQVYRGVSSPSLNLRASEASLRLSQSLLFAKDIVLSSESYSANQCCATLRTNDSFQFYGCVRAPVMVSICASR